LETDIETAARFLAALTGDAEHTFQTYDDDKKRKHKPLNRILYGSLRRHSVALSMLNLKGAAVAVLINRGDQMGRASDNVRAARALWVDLDGAPIEPVLEGPIRPRIVVESSPGKWHAYWPLVDLPLDQFSKAQHALADRFGGDHSVAERSRVMRLPGFWHNKGAPFQSRLLTADHAPLTWSEMTDAFGLEKALRLPSVIPKGTRNSELYRLAKSARNAGVPEVAQLEKARKVNAARCVPPLSDAEVVQVVANAYSGEGKAVWTAPCSLWGLPEFLALRNSDRVLLLAAYPRANGYNNGAITLPWSELRPLFPKSKTFYATRKRLVKSGLLSVLQEPAKAMPRIGRKPTATLFQLRIGPFLAPYARDPVGPFMDPPEALQAPAPPALDPASEDSGPERCAA
jgi:hypothetical protein